MSSISLTVKPSSLVIEHPPRTFLQKALHWITNLFFRIISCLLINKASARGFEFIKVQKADSTLHVSMTSAKNAKTRSLPFLVKKKTLEKATQTDSPNPTSSKTYSDQATQTDLSIACPQVVSNKALSKNIFSFLQGEDLNTLSKISKTWNEWSKDEKVWHPAIKKEFSKSWNSIIQMPQEERGTLKEIFLQSLSLTKFVQRTYSQNSTLNQIDGRNNPFLNFSIHPFEEGLEKIHALISLKFPDLAQEDLSESRIDLDNFESSLIEVIGSHIDPITIKPQKLGQCLKDDPNLRKELLFYAMKYNQALEDLAKNLEEYLQNPYPSSIVWTATNLKKLRTCSKYILLILKMLACSVAMYKLIIEKAEKKNVREVLGRTQWEELIRFEKYANDNQQYHNPS